jgi:hypothetical protein
MFTAASLADLDATVHSSSNALISITPGYDHSMLSQ